MFTHSLSTSCQDTIPNIVAICDIIRYKQNLLNEPSRLALINKPIIAPVETASACKCAQSVIQ